MLTLSAKTRTELGRKVKNLREEGILPGVLYGPKVKNTPIETNLKEFEKAYQEIGESSLVSLEVDTSTGSAQAKKKFLVLVHDVEFDPITDKPIHVDFYQPKLDVETEVSVPLVFEGESKAVKDLGGTLVRNIHEIRVKALPEKLPHEIKVSIEKLLTFEDNVLIKDLEIPEGVKVQREPDEIIATVTPVEKVEEELEKPIEEKVEDVEKVEGKQEEEKMEGEESKKEKADSAKSK